MTRFRMISRCGEGLALLRRVQSEGYECDYWAPSTVPGDLYEGLIARVEDWHDGLDDETIVLFDAPGSGRLTANLPRSWGAGALNDVLQFDRAFGLKIARIHGLKVPAWERFKDIASAVEYLQEHEGRWDLELPNGQVFYENQTAHDMGELLEFSEPLTDFYLIERIEGQALTCSAWYVGGEIVSGSLFSTIEPRRFLAGEYGPVCQPPFCLGWFWPPKHKRDGETTPTLYRHTFKRLEPFLSSHRYQGPTCLRLRIGKADGIPCFYGFETGFRYPALYAMAEGIKGSWAEILTALAQYEQPKLTTTSNWLAAMALSVPPYPYGLGRANHLVRGPLDGDHIWPLDVKTVAGYNFTAGAHGIVAHVTAQADDRKDLAGKLMRICETLHVSDKQLRYDGLESDEAIMFLKDWHYF